MLCPQVQETKASCAAHGIVQPTALPTAQDWETTYSPAATLLLLGASLRACVRV